MSAHGSGSSLEQGGGDPGPGSGGLQQGSGSHHLGSGSSMQGSGSLHQGNVGGSHYEGSGGSQQGTGGHHLGSGQYQPAPASQARSFFVGMSQLQQPSQHPQAMAMHHSNQHLPGGVLHAHHYSHHQQQQQQQYHHHQHPLPSRRPVHESFQKLLSAPVFPDSYNSTSTSHGHQTGPGHHHQHMDGLPAAFYSGQVLQRPHGYASSQPAGLASYAVQGQEHAHTHLHHPPMPAGALQAGSAIHHFQQPAAQLQTHTAQIPPAVYPSGQTPAQVCSAGAAHSTHPSVLTHVTSSGFAANAPQALDRHAYYSQAPSVQPMYLQQHHLQPPQQQAQPPSQAQLQAQGLSAHSQAGLSIAQQQHEVLPSSVMPPGADLGQPLASRSGSVASVQSTQGGQQQQAHAGRFPQSTWMSAGQQQDGGMQPLVPAAQGSAPLPTSFSPHQPSCGTGVGQDRSQGLDLLGQGQGQGHSAEDRPGQGALQQPLVLPGRPSGPVAQPSVGFSSGVSYSQGYSSGSWPERNPGGHCRQSKLPVC